MDIPANSPPNLEFDMLIKENNTLCPIGIKRTAFIQNIRFKSWGIIYDE